MKKSIILTFALTFSAIAFCDTYLTNQEEVYGTWKKSGSPYIVQGEVIVPENKTLTIEAGVEVKFQTGENRFYRENDEISEDFDLGFMRVKGKLIVRGTKKAMVRFSANGVGNWGNVFFENSNGNKLSYCWFSGAYYMRNITEFENATGALSFINSSANVENCVFSNNGWTAINCKNGSTPLFSNITIVGNKYGIECNSESNPTFEKIILWNNENEFYINGDSKPTIKNSAIQSDDLPSSIAASGTILLNKDPKFKNVDDAIYTLKGNSPCKKLKMGAQL